MQLLAAIQPKGLQMPNKWGYSDQFYRVPLKDFIRFDEPLSLLPLLERRKTELLEYFVRNRQRVGPAHRHVFFVHQSNRLQCLDGASGVAVRGGSIEEP